MSSYQPGPDETALLTVEVRLGTDGIYVIEGERGATRMFLHSTSPAIVRVEPLPKPALPTAFGARIVATRMVGADVGNRTELVRVGDWWIAAADEGRYEDEELSDVEVLWPTAEAAAPIPEPEPLKPPTKFGAVVVAVCHGETGLAVRSDPGSLHPWFVILPRSRIFWVSDRDLIWGEILAPGVDVDLP